jgi:hypothetical protein
LDMKLRDDLERLKKIRFAMILFRHDILGRKQYTFFFCSVSFFGLL